MNIVLTPIKAIRAKCIDCCCGDKKEVRECSIKDALSGLTGWVRDR